MSFLSWYFFIPTYYLLGAIYLLFGVHNKRFIKCILKCIPVAVLLLQMLTVFVDYIGSSDAQKNQAVYIKQFLWGLAFSAIGDVCLVFRGVFVAGIISFGISLCLYISALGLVESVQDMGFTGVLCGLCILSMSVGFLLMFKNQMVPTKLNPLARLVLTVLIIFYFIILSTLLWSGALLCMRQTDMTGICSVIGAAMFYTSDMLIAAGAIWEFRVLQGRGLVMITYYSAQLLLALSLYLKLQESQHSVSTL